MDPGTANCEKNGHPKKQKSPHGKTAKVHSPLCLRRDCAPVQDVLRRDEMHGVLCGDPGELRSEREETHGGPTAARLGVEK